MMMAAWIAATAMAIDRRDERPPSVAHAMRAPAPRGKQTRPVDPKPVGSPADWFGPEDYPMEAIRRDEQGLAVARIDVDSLGKPIACVIGTSSGSAVLDQVTCDLVMAKAFFDPAVDARGRAVAGHLSLPVRWSLPDVSEASLQGTVDVAQPGFRPVRSDLMVSVAVSPDGLVTRCEVSPPLPRPMADGPCSPYPVGKKVSPALSRNGRPVGARIIERSIHEIEYDP